MPDSDDPQNSRRDFLLASAAITLGQAGLVSCTPNNAEKHIEASPAQKAFRRKEKSSVAIQKCSSYTDNLPELIEPWIQTLGLGAIADKNIFLKMNMVDYRSDRPLTTDPALIEALIKTFAKLGAKEILVGDGPALNRDTDYLLAATGTGDCCKRNGVKFVDLNIDELRKVENPLKFTGIEYFLLPRSIVEADLVISVPKLKTHRWARFTASMKNIFGVVPGRRYGWPKNILHVKGIDLSIIDLVSTVKPGFCVVDAIVAMEGEGPLSGEAVNSGFIVLGNDPAAVDSVCARAIGIDPEIVSYMRIAEQTIGNTQLKDIEILGEPLKNVSQKFRLPERFNTLNNSSQSQRESNFGAT